VNGLWGYHLVRGDPQITRALVARQCDLAARSTRALEQLMAAHADGTTLFYCGEFARALPRLSEAVRLYEEALEAHLARGGGRPWRIPATSGPLYLGWCLQMLGKLEQGLAQQSFALTQAERLRDAFVHVEAMTHVVALLHDRREPARARELSDLIVARSEELGFRLWLGVGKSARGWARSQLGELEAGMAELEEGFEIFRRTGSMVPLVYRVSYVVEAHLAAGRSEAGLAAIDDALARSSGRLDRFYDAEMLRLRGDLLRQRGELERAEAELERALALARSQGARLFELRAAVGLARLRAESGRRASAREILEPVHGAFSEGFDTPDLRDAASLLAELGGA
jgi:tetratricopeptide (TPR) repeat protein